MFYLDNSETSWLVYADWLEDQDIDASHIRENVVNPITNDWYWESYNSDVGCSESKIGGDYFHGEVGVGSYERKVGGYCHGNVGGFAKVGGV